MEILGIRPRVDAGARQVVVMPEDAVVNACVAHMEGICAQFEAVTRYARHEVLGGAGFDGVFRALVPMLDRVGDAVADGIGALGSSYAETLAQFVASSRSMGALDDSLAASLQSLGRMAGGSTGGSSGAGR